MGNSVGIYILLDSNVQAGELCSGKVVIEAKKSLKGMTDVTLTMTGKEKVRARLSTTQVDASEHTFFNEVIELKRFNPSDKVKKGTHVFPFTIVMPGSLPATTKYPSNNAQSDGYRIQYKMVAKIGGSDKSGPVCEREVQVQAQPLPPEKSVYMMPPTTHKVLGMRNKPAGVLTLGAKSLETHIGRGETIQLHLAARNFSTVCVKRVHARVVERIELMSQKKQTAAVVKEETLSELKNVISPGLERSQRNRNSIKLTKAVALQELHESIYEDLNSGDNEFQLPVPIFARETYNGTLVKVSHFIEINVQMGTMSNAITKIIPIEIGQPSLSCTIMVEDTGPVSSLSFYPEMERTPKEDMQMLTPASSQSDDTNMLISDDSEDSTNWINNLAGGDPPGFSPRRSHDDSDNLSEEGFEVVRDVVREVAQQVPAQPNRRKSFLGLMPMRRQAMSPLQKKQ